MAGQTEEAGRARLAHGGMKRHATGWHAYPWKRALPTNCPHCDAALTVYDFETKACCPTHGIVADKTPLKKAHS